MFFEQAGHVTEVPAMSESASKLCPQWMQLNFIVISSLLPNATREAQNDPRLRG